MGKYIKVSDSDGVWASREDLAGPDDPTISINISLCPKNKLNTRSTLCNAGWILLVFHKKGVLCG